jgi:hypothetical protein
VTLPIWRISAQWIWPHNAVDAHVARCVATASSKSQMN